MLLIRKNLLKKIFLARLSDDIDEIVGMAQHGFDVVVRSSSSDLADIIYEILAEELNNHPVQFLLAKSIKEMFELEAKLVDKEVREHPFVLLPTFGRPII